jgi:L-ascorbate metabolism protein UlaG (beta-lactamase superfamily)
MKGGRGAFARTMRNALVLSLLFGACGGAGVPAADERPGTANDHPKGPLVEVTYLGVAGWLFEVGDLSIVADPYFSRPALDKPLVPDDAAIAQRSPARADLVIVGHSHFDHLLDAPSVAKRTGAEIMGSATTAHVARASGVAPEKIITVKGGEDLAWEDYSVRVIPSLHSALGDKHVFGGVLEHDPVLPMGADDYVEGGTFAYLLRLHGREIFVLDTANFIEREVAGLDPDIAIVATGLRQEIHDYTCRLLHALGDPPIVIANHFDDFRGPPVDAPIDADLEAFTNEVEGCAPGTLVIVPRHFDTMTL